MPGGNKGEGNVSNNLYHFGARYYDPTTGRWTQQDPLGHLGSAGQGDRYLYAGDDPINLSDPAGLSLGQEIFDGSALGATCAGSADPVAGFFCVGGIIEVEHDNLEQGGSEFQHAFEEAATIGNKIG